MLFDYSEGVSSDWKVDNRMKTLLVINDDPLLLDALAEILELEGYRVLRARTSIEGLWLALHEQPHGIICDLATRGLGSYAVYDILQTTPETVAIPFILMTDTNMSFSVSHVPKLPDENIIPKPFPIEYLLTVVSQFTQHAIA